MVQSARVVLTAYIGRLRAVLAKIANMPERNAGFCSACSRWFKAFPKIVHSANVVKEIVEPEEALLFILPLQFPSPSPPSGLLGLLKTAGRLGTIE